MDQDRDEGRSVVDRDQGRSVVDRAQGAVCCGQGNKILDSLKCRYFLEYVATISCSRRTLLNTVC